MRLIGATVLFSVLLQAMVRQNEIRTETLAYVALLELDFGKCL